MALFISALAVSANYGTAQAATEVSGILISNTTWTKTNSPYTLIGPVGIESGVTLTIEAGVTVNGQSDIEVNGTLVAIGSDNNEIHINVGKISFTETSSSWNEQTGSGCIIENANLVCGIEIKNVSPKINSNTIGGIIDVFWGSPIISNNKGGAINIGNGPPIITNNIISKISCNGYSGAEGLPIISDNAVYGDIFVGGSPTITGNTIKGTVEYKGYYGSLIISNNVISPPTRLIESSVWIIPDRIVIYPGIALGGNKDLTAHISDNVISGGTNGIQGGTGCTATIERNLIFNNTEAGIDISSEVTIKDNTITNNTIGITNPFPSSTIRNNNIYGNGRFNLYSEATSDVDATNNWWGTTDQTSIKQSIYYVENNYKYGTVIFVPYLNEPNPTAPEAPYFPTSTPSPTSPPSPTTTPTQPPSSTPYQEPQQTDLEVVVGAVITAIVIGAGLGLLIYLIKRK